MIPEILPADSIFICNTGSSKRPGSHWVMVAKKDGIVYVGHSLRNEPMFHRNIVLNQFDALKILNRVELQREPFWGLYCICSSFSLFSNFHLYNVMTTLSYVSLRRHSRMYLYVTMENFVCLFWKFCLLNKSSSFEFLCKENKSRKSILNKNWIHFVKLDT